MYIRRACQKDIPELGRLLCQVLSVHHAGRPDLFKGNTRKYDDDELADILHDEERPIFVALEQEKSPQLLGYAFCVFQQHTDDNVLTPIRTLYIDDICVDEAARRQGVGRALYTKVQEFACEQGFHNITLNVWECNPGARTFYESLGLIPYRIGLEQLL